MADSFTSQNLQALINQYNKNKDKICSGNSDCAINKKLLELEIKFRKAELGLQTGDDEMWNAKREMIHLKEGPGGLRKKVTKKADKFVQDLEKTFKEITDNLNIKANGVDNQNSYIEKMDEMIEFYNSEHNKIQSKYDKIINTNNINKRLATFYSADEEYVKPFINILEKIYWPILIITTLVLIFKIATGSYPTMKEKIFPILSLLFLYIAPLFFRKFANTFQPYQYRGFRDSDVDDPKRYKNLVE